MENTENQALSLEEKLQAAEEKIKQLEGEKDKFFNIISFWLGSPLSSMKMLSEMLLADSERMDKNGILEFNKHLNNQIMSLHSQMGNLIEWTSFEVGNFSVNKTAFDLKTCIEKTLKLHQPQADKKNIVINNLLTQKISVLGDEKMLSVALSNLLSNAVKFCKKEDTITIATQELESGKIQISIKDTGIGMGKAKMRNIFNPERKSMQKGTANESGFGIGMPLIKKILELHDTILTLESSQGQGTLATFVLEVE